MPESPRRLYLPATSFLDRSSRNGRPRPRGLRRAGHGGRPPPGRVVRAPCLRRSLYPGGRAGAHPRAAPQPHYQPFSRPKDASGFIVLPPRRWVVERSLAWMMHAHRHARDCERLIQHSETLITWAAIALMTRRPARKATPSWARRPAPTNGSPTPSTRSRAARTTIALPRPGRDRCFLRAR
ncbi:transposase, partial [Streptomyces sp. PKU-MA01144]|nr:transposase [Streptomyces sp. PKU-MA01144]